MYVTWGGWWWFFWLLPMVVILWAVIGWSGRRRYGYDRYGMRYRNFYDDTDDDWVARHRSNATHRHRNRAPKNYRRSEARIQEDVCDRLMLDDDIDPSGVEVRVSEGVVSLTGTVASRFEKRIAERIADSVAGVTDVENKLRIGNKVDAVSRPQPRDTNVATANTSSTAPH